MPYDEAAKKRTMNYLKKLKEIRFRVKPEDYERYEKAAADAAICFSVFIEQVP